MLGSIATSEVSDELSSVSSDELDVMGDSSNKSERSGKGKERGLTTRGKSAIAKLDNFLTCEEDNRFPSDSEEGELLERNRKRNSAPRKITLSDLFPKKADAGSEKSLVRLPRKTSVIMPPPSGGMNQQQGPPQSAPMSSCTPSRVSGGSVETPSGEIKKRRARLTSALKSCSDFVDALCKREKNWLWPLLRPDNKTVFSDPIYLQDIRNNFDARVYKRVDEFAADMRKLIRNFTSKFPPDQPYYDSALRLSVLFEAEMKKVDEMISSKPSKRRLSRNSAGEGNGLGLSKECGLRGDMRMSVNGATGASAPVDLSLSVGPRFSFGAGFYPGMPLPLSSFGPRVGERRLGNGYPVAPPPVSENNPNLLFADLPVGMCGGRAPENPSANRILQDSGQQTELDINVETGKRNRESNEGDGREKRAREVDDSLPSISVFKQEVLGVDNDEEEQEQQQQNHVDPPPEPPANTAAVDWILSGVRSIPDQGAALRDIKNLLGVPYDIRELTELLGSADPDALAVVSEHVLQVLVGPQTRKRKRRCSCKVASDTISVSKLEWQQIQGDLAVLNSMAHGMVQKVHTMQTGSLDILNNNLFEA